MSLARIDPTTGRTPSRLQSGSGSPGAGAGRRPTRGGDAGPYPSDLSGKTSAEPKLFICAGRRAAVLSNSPGVAVGPATLGGRIENWELEGCECPVQTPEPQLNAAGAARNSARRETTSTARIEAGRASFLRRVARAAATASPGTLAPSACAPRCTWPRTAGGLPDPFDARSRRTRGMQAAGH